MADAATLRVVVAHRPPFVFVDETSGLNGTSRVYGLLIDLLSRVLETSNLTSLALPSYYPSPTNAGGTLSNGVWSGMVGELVAGRADVALFPLTRTAARLTAIDCTFSYLDQGLSMLVMNQDTDPGPLSVLAPFTTTLWVLLLCTVFAVSLLFWLLDAYGRYVRKKEAAALHQNDERVVKIVTGRRSHVLVSLMAAAGAPETPDRKSSWGVQVLYIVYCFWCLIVLSAYTANLTSYLAVQKATASISGMQDLLRDNLLLGVNPNGSTAAYFASSYDTLATQLQPNVRYCDTPTCIEWLRSGEVAAFVSDRPLLSYQANLRPCDLAVVGDDFGPGNLVIGLQKGSPLLAPFNAAIQRFAEDGTLTSLRRSWFDGLSQCDDVGDSQLDNSRLGITQLLGVFVFLGIGVVLAFATGTVENLRWCLKRRYPELARKPSAYLAQTWDRASSSLRLRRSNTGSKSVLAHAASSSPFPGRGSISGITKCDSGDADGSGGVAAWGSPPPYKYADKDVRVSIGEVPSLLVSEEGKPTSYDRGSHPLCDMSSVRQSRHGAALPNGGSGGGSRSNPAVVTSPFAAASAVGAGAIDVTKHGSAGSSAQGWLGRGGAVGKGGAACSPGLALHHRLALRCLGHTTHANTQRGRDREAHGHRGSGEQVGRTGCNVSTSAKSGAAVLVRHGSGQAPPPPPSQRQEQQQQGVIVLGKPEWRRQESLGRELQAHGQQPWQQQQQQRGHAEPLVAVALDGSPTRHSDDARAGEQGRLVHQQQPAGMLQHEQHKGQVVQCDSLVSAASSSYGASHTNDVALIKTPSLRVTRGSPSEAAPCADAVVQEQHEDRPQQGEGGGSEEAE